MSDVPERKIRPASDRGEAEEEKEESNAITETGNRLLLERMATRSLLTDCLH